MSSLSDENFYKSNSGKKPSSSNKTEYSEGKVLATFEVTVRILKIAHPSLYQTVVHHLTSGQDETFEELLGDRTLTWMRSRVLTAQQDVVEKSALLNAQPLVSISRLEFIQPGNPSSPVLLDLVPKRIPAALLENMPFTLSINFAITPKGKQQLAKKETGFVSCQIQAFVKPLSPIRSTNHWKSSLSKLLSAAETHYQAQFPSISLGGGIYSLQLLILMSNLRSVPVLLEVPVFQVQESST